MATRKRRAPGAAIQAYLEKHGLSQQDFADQLGVSQVLISQWIKGRTRITPERAADIMEATAGEVSPQQLFPRLFAGSAT